MAKRKNQRAKVRGQLGQPRLVRNVAPRSVKPVDVRELEPATEVVTERTYITTKPELEIRKPATLAQASRIDGITPAALLLLLAHLKKQPARKSA